MDSGRHYVFGVANDTFGCYKWDFETCQIVTTYTIPPTTTRSIIQNTTLYTMVYIQSTKELIMGGEDGQLRIWDTQTDQCRDVLNVQMMTNSSSTITNHVLQIQNDTNRGRPTTMNPQLNGTSSSSTTSPQLYISTCKVWNEQWWIIGGGFHPSKHSISSSSSSPGYIAIIHGPTRSLLSTLSTPYKIQQLFLYRPSTSNDPNALEDTRLMALTNTNYTYSWKNPLALTDTTTVTQNVWCHTPSAYAISTIDHTSMITVGGVGSVLDVYKDGTQLCRSLSTN